MKKESRPVGLRFFLYGLLELIKEQRKLSCTEVEQLISQGVASYLYSVYSKTFDSVSFDPDNVFVLDGYYRNMAGCREEKYACGEQEGLYLLIKLALDEFN